MKCYIHKDKPLGIIQVLVSRIEKFALIHIQYTTINFKNVIIEKLVKINHLQNMGTEGVDNRDIMSTTPPGCCKK